MLPVQSGFSRSKRIYVMLNDKRVQVRGKSKKIDRWNWDSDLVRERRSKKIDGIVSNLLVITCR